MFRHGPRVRACRLLGQRLMILENLSPFRPVMRQAWLNPFSVVKRSTVPSLNAALITARAFMLSLKKNSAASRYHGRV